MNDMVQIISILGHNESHFFFLSSINLFLQTLYPSLPVYFLIRALIFLKQEFISSFIGSLAKKQHKEQARRPHIRKWLKAQTQARH